MKLETIVSDAAAAASVTFDCLHKMFLNPGETRVGLHHQPGALFCISLAGMLRNAARGEFREALHHLDTVRMCLDWYAE